jgi:hypothetical protein
MALTARGATKNATIVRKLLTHRATVYTRTANTGPYNLVVKTGLACRLEAVQRQPAATSSERRDLANIGTLRYDATYDLPAGAIQVAVDAFPGQRWNVIQATAWPDDVPGMGVVGRTVDVTRAL